MSRRESLKQVSLIFACGTALFSDGYSNGVINAVNTLLTRIYGSAALARHNYSITLSSITFAGFVIGMLGFGYLSDKWGRKFGMMASTVIIAFFSLLSAASSGAHGSVDGMLAMLSACRFCIGVGLGAEYPCGSVAASEQSEESGVARNAQHRWLALATNTMITLGMAIASFVPLVLFWMFGEHHLRAVWRISLGLGFIPAFFVFLWRLNMDEPMHYKRHSMKRIRIPYWLAVKRYWVPLVGISLTWFIFDFIVYPFHIYSSSIVNNITGGNQSLTIVLGWSCVIGVFSLPGTVIGAFVGDWIGPRNTMLFGLVFQAIIGFIMSGLYERLSQHVGAFAVVYGIFLSFASLGPGNCTIILAAKAGPTAVRGQFYAIAAASGKIGALVGTLAFPPIIDAFGGPDSMRGNTGPFWISSGLCVLSIIILMATVRELTHDGMIEEDIKFREYLVENGFDVSMMGIESETTTRIGDEGEKDRSSEDIKVAV